MSTPATTPPMRDSNEATSQQLDVARAEGDAYGKALRAMAAEDGARLARAGDYLVAFVNENAEGMYAPAEDHLVWREAAEEANTHLEVAVADAADGRFVPGLTVRIAVHQGDHPVLSTELPFLWHPFLHHYGSNARVPGAGPYTVIIEIAPAPFMRHDPINGKRYAAAVTARFEDVHFEIGRKPSPDAQPRGQAAPTAGADG